MCKSRAQRYNSNKSLFNTPFPKSKQIQEAHKEGHVVGLDLETGKPMDPQVEGVWDNYCVKRQLLQLALVVASQLLLVGKILKASKSNKGGNSMASEETELCFGGCSI